MTAESPFRRLRLLSGTMQKSLAEQAGLSVTALVQVEQGRYETVPARANMALARACRNAGIAAPSVLREEYGATSLDEAMRIWQRRQRQAFDLSAVPPLDLEELIERFGNADAFCKRLCVPVATLYNYRSGKLKTLPSVLREALYEAHYPHVDEMERITSGG